MSVATTALLHPQLDVEERLDPAHEQIVRDTLPVVGEHIEEIAPVFYGRMFAAHPELLRDTFNRGNQAQGAQQKALAASVATYATLLVTPDGPSPAALLSRIGHKHVSLGITEDQYGIVHEHLMAAIVEVLGADVVTGDVAAAWDAVYWHMARTLIAFEHGLYAEAQVAPGDVFRTARVTRRVEESSRVASFELAALEGEEPLADFLPGQYISVGVRLPDGARQLRQYSLSDAPGQGRWRISVRREDGAPEGEVSSHLHRTLREGDELQVTLPAGDLVLDPQATSPLVLVSAGIGLTPMLGMLRHLAAVDSGREVVVLHADRDAADAAHRGRGRNAGHDPAAGPHVRGVLLPADPSAEEEGQEGQGNAGRPEKRRPRVHHRRHLRHHHLHQGRHHRAQRGPRQCQAGLCPLGHPQRGGSRHRKRQRGPQLTLFPA